MRSNLPQGRVIAIDPGTYTSGIIYYDDGRVEHANPKIRNEHVWEYTYLRPSKNVPVVCEMIASYGMPVGAEVFETCLWIGWFWKEARLQGREWNLVYRKDVKMHLCGTPRAKDANVRQAIIDMFPSKGGGKIPQIGTKKQPGPLYGVKSHAWAALAVALTFLGTRWEIEIHKNSILR